jgi:hypothetical protein
MALTSDNEDERAKAAIECCKGTSFSMEGSRSTLVKRLIDAFANCGHRSIWD